MLTTIIGVVLCIGVASIAVYFAERISEFMHDENIMDETDLLNI